MSEIKLEGTDYKYNDLDDMITRRENLMDSFTPNGNRWDALMELLEIERKLTQMEE